MRTTRWAGCTHSTPNVRVIVIGTVIQAGTVLLPLVPKEGVLRAEVWISNEDIVRKRQTVKLKFAAFPFQKYGLAEGVVEHVRAHAA